MERKNRAEKKALSKPRLKYERERLGWTLAYVAAWIDCPDPHMIGRWERGATSPSPCYRQTLYELFGKNAEELGLLPKEPGEIPAQASEQSVSQAGEESAVLQQHSSFSSSRGDAADEDRRFLPTQLTSFVGREQEILSVCELLRRIALFLERTRTVLPNFTLDETNAHVIANLCIHLDGLPLAIELAVPRLKMLSPQTLLERLDHRLEILTNGMRDAPVRQQTLRNTLMWSYHLLNPIEQRLFCYLSVFVGGCTFQTIEILWATLENGQEKEQVLDSIASLLDKSMLQRAVQKEGEEPRLLMLRTIREFGLERLSLDGKLEQTQLAHARYYLSLAEEAEPALKGSQALPWLERLEREHDNLHEALRYLILYYACSHYWQGLPYPMENSSMSLIDPDATVKIPRIRGALRLVHTAEPSQLIQPEIADELAQRNNIEHIQARPLPVLESISRSTGQEDVESRQIQPFSTPENANRLRPREVVERVPEDAETDSSIRKKEQQSRVRNKHTKKIRAKRFIGSFFKQRVPVLHQMSMVECGAACLAMILTYYGRKTSVSEVRERCGVGRDGLSAFGIVRAARSYGLRTRAISFSCSHGSLAYWS